jgi:murein DD-endopeptidase MepM/ murein hydrolase activator NlpD
MPNLEAVSFRILRVALICAGLYGLALGHAAIAQDPTPDPTPSVTATATLTLPATTPTATPTAFATSTATGTATAAATEAAPAITASGATSEPTATASASAATPEATASATATGSATATVTTSPTATPTRTARRRAARRRAKVCQAETGEVAGIVGERVSGEELSTSASAQACLERAARAGARKEKAAAEKAAAEARAKAPELVTSDVPVRRSDGKPTTSNPTFTQADLGAARIGVPNFFIDKFRIPPFLLPIYQAAGNEYGVRWEILAAINEIETDYGRNLNVSSAGALGWMQFMPATWDAYGVDANQDKLKDPYNPADAIFAAARYLRAAGAETDLRKAIFAYNHADWYVDSVLMRARVIGGLPADLVGSLTGLTQARFPVYAKATYAGDLAERAARGKRVASGNAAFVVESKQDRRGIRIYARSGAPAIAVNDGRIVRIGKTPRLGRYVQLQDAYGNVFTYAHLGSVAARYPVAKQRKVSAAAVRRELDLPKDPQPTRAASATGKRRVAANARRAAVKERRAANAGRSKAAVAEAAAQDAVLPVATPEKTRLFAHPGRPNARAAGGDEQLGVDDFEPMAGGPLKVNARRWTTKPLRKGARVIAGTILGRVGKVAKRSAPHLLFEIRPAGRGAPRIDPKPILDGWKLLETTAIYRAAGRNPFFGTDAATPTVGQILLMSKEALIRRVLSNPRIDMYACGRNDVRTGEIDRRVLATLELLAASGLRPTVTSLRCGHGYYTASGNVSHHSSGNAVDIAAVNGIPILGHQGRGSITDTAVRRLLTFQGTMRPDQIITLMTYEGAPNTFAMGDHHDHIHVGFRPAYGTEARTSKSMDAVLKPKQWIKLIQRLKEIDNPTVRRQPSEAAVKVKRASKAHKGD